MKYQLELILSSLCLTGLLGLSVTAAETLVQRDGQRLQAEQFLYDGKQFTAPGNVVPQAQVSDWYIGDAKPAAAATPAAGKEAPATTAVAESAITQLKAWRAEAQALAARYPGCKGVQVLDEGTYRLTPDHRHLYRYHFVGLVLNEELLGWGNLAFGFTEGRSRVRVVEARCLTADDRSFELQPKDLTTGTGTSGGDVHFDPNSRQLTGTIPGVEVGAMVDYTYEHDEYAPEDWRIFFPSFYFQGDTPVNYSIFHVEVPTGTPLLSWEENWQAGSAESTSTCWNWLLPWRWFPSRPFTHERNVVREDGKAYDAWHWTRTDVAPLVAEPAMPPMPEIAPGVHATILTDWSHLNQLIGGMQRERLAVTPTVAAKVKELTAGAATPEAKLAILYHWVQKNIRYISIKSSLSSGWSGHPAAETLANGYGDCTDKSNLLTAMLTAAGITAEPVVLRTNDAGLFYPRYPMVVANHCITQVHLDGRTFYLDSTTQDHRYPALRSDDHGVIAYNFIRGERERIPVPPGVEAKGKISDEAMALAADGTLRVDTKNHYTGQFEAGLRAGWKQVPEEQRRQVLQQYLNGIAPGARLQQFTLPDPQNLDEPFGLAFTYGLPDYVIKTGDLRLFQFPERERKFPEVSLETRRFPVSYTTSEAVERHITLRLPPEFRVLEPPPPVSLGNAYVAYSESYAVTGDTLTATIRFERKARQIPAADYPEYRRLLGAIETATKRPLYLTTAAK